MKKLIFIIALLISFSSCEQTAKEYHERGMDKAAKLDYTGAIADYTKAIELDPNYAIGYYNRGVSKDKSKDYYGAIADFIRAIELNPNYTSAYYNKGLAKHNLEDYSGAITDYNKAIELNTSLAVAYHNRAICKALSDIDGCADARKAKELGYDSDKLIRIVCN